MANRQFNLPFAELVDRLTVDQIKEVLLPASRASYADEMQRIAADLDAMIKEQKISLNARLIRMIVVLAQMNMHIWINKDKMAQDSSKYLEYLKFAHQLNGVRNRIKNSLLTELGSTDQSALRTNVATDGLDDSLVSI
jgi:hypothetical protein